MLLVVAKNLLFHLVCLRRADRYLALKGRLVRGVARLGGYERAFMRLLPSLARRGSDVIDAGANVGAYTTALARAVGASGRVFAFEPVAPVADLLEHACRRLPNVTIIREVLSTPPPRSMTIRVPMLPGGVPEPALATVETAPWPARAGARPWATFETAAGPLDAHIGRFRDVSFIKADLEGHEGPFLEGATRTIAAFRPVVQIEACGVASNEPALRTWLDEHGYRLYSLAGGRLQETPPGQTLPLNVYLVPREVTTDLGGGRPGRGADRR